MAVRQRLALTTCSTLLLTGAALAGGNNWVDLVNETSVRMPTGGDLNDPTTSVNDVEEKDYAWGDIDQDGDIDLVCVRKQPFTSEGKNTNVLFMNEGIADGHAIDGVLVDRTEEYATASTVAGDMGFMTATNDRDVILYDVTGDGWLDMITCTTLSDGDPDHIKDPRIYVNLGEEKGEWQGFRYEHERFPFLHATAGPRFCSVAAGDIDNDGDFDLWFGDYDSGGFQIFDFNNRLFLNDGNGFFTDVTGSRMTAQMTGSNFGAASAIRDMNGDGFNEAIKQTSLAAPTVVATIYNDPSNPGFFNHYEETYTNAAYFVSIDDLNNDGRLDMVVVDDGTDRYLINTGNDSNGRAQYLQLTFPGSGGFGGNSIAEDLNNDGFRDVIITDVDVDISGCTRDTLIYRNLGDVPNVTMQEQGQVIPENMLLGVHDAAVFDLNGDGWKDIIFGRCTGTQVWMNQPPSGLIFSYPQGLPGIVDPDSTTTFQIKLDSVGDVAPEDDSARLFASVDDEPFAEVPLTYLGNDLYEGQLPAAACSHIIEFYITGELENGSDFSDPAGAPDSAYAAFAANGVDIVLRDEIEGDVSEWTVENSNVSFGAWEQAEPNGTIYLGSLMAPNVDATQSGDAVMAFVTGNGAPDGEATASDLDGGPTILTSPTFDLLGTDGTISYSRWFRTELGTPDALTVEISNDNGATWIPIPEETTFGTLGEWEVSDFVVSDYVTPSESMRVRFITMDFPNDSVTEAGIDNFQIEAYDCAAPCPADIAGDDGTVNVDDLLMLLGNWGTGGAGAEIAAPFDVVDVNDLLALLGAFGDCL